MSFSLRFLLFWGIFVKTHWSDMYRTPVYCLVCIRYLILLCHLPLHSPSFLPKVLSPIAKFSGQLLGLALNPSSTFDTGDSPPFSAPPPVVSHNATPSYFLPAFTSPWTQLSQAAPEGQVRLPSISARAPATTRSVCWRFLNPHQRPWRFPESQR